MSKEVVETLYNKIRDDLKSARKLKDRLLSDAIRFVMGEIQRDPDKDYSNTNVKGIIKAVRKNLSKSPKPDHIVIKLIDSYVGKPVASGEVIEWLVDNNYTPDLIKNQKNPFAIIGILKKEFSDRELDGNMVKGILADMIEGSIKVNTPVTVEDIPKEGLMMSLIKEVYPEADWGGGKVLDESFKE